VNESHEPSYYEIALTHRQVLVAFVVLLVALVAAFFTGVWVGKGGAAAPLAAEATKPAPSPASAPLEEFRFFSEEGQRPAASVPPPAPAQRPAVPAPGPGTTLVADLEAEAAPAPPASVPTPEREVETPEPAPAAPPPAATAGRAPEEGGLVVQVFSSPDAVQARRILQRLTAGGFRAFLSPVEVGSQTMHRVRIGPFAERGEAQRVADQVRQRFKLDTWITH
jgi:cell division septation protein DedD